MENFSLGIQRNPSTADLMVILALAFGTVAACHAAADLLAPWIESNYPGLSKFSLDSKFFWLIVLATVFR